MCDFSFCMQAQASFLLDDFNLPIQLLRPVDLSTSLQKGWLVFSGIPVTMSKPSSWELDGAVAQRYSTFFLCTRL